jgi:hypothetical protein
MTNINVVQSWLAGRGARSGSVRTDGKSIYSYALEIARFDADKDRFLVLDRDASPSRTTSSHLGLVWRGVDREKLIVPCRRDGNKLGAPVDEAWSVFVHKMHHLFSRNKPVVKVDPTKTRVHLLRAAIAANEKMTLCRMDARPDMCAVEFGVRCAFGGVTENGADYKADERRTTVILEVPFSALTFVGRKSAALKALLESLNKDGRYGR